MIRNFLGFGTGADTIREGAQSPRPSATPGKNVSFDTAMTVSSFWASVRLLAEAVAAMPLQCFDIASDGSKTKNSDYRLFRILNYKPNSYQTRTEFFEYLVMCIATWGNFYGVRKEVGGVLHAVIPLSPAQMRVEIVEGKLAYIYTEADGSVRAYAATSIWHIKLFGNGVVGMSALAYMARSLGIAIEADQRVAALAESGGKATGVLTVDKALTETQRTRLKENFKGMESGSESGLFVLEAGFEYQQISISPADMQLIENRRFQIEDVARFIGVPSVLINDTSATTVWGSGIGQITQGFYKLNLRPYLERIESSAKRWMMPPEDWETVELRFNFDALLRADKQERIESNSVAINSMQMTPNEARAEEGKPPVEGGHALFGNSTLIPITEAAAGGEGADDETT